MTILVNSNSKTPWNAFDLLFCQQEALSCCPNNYRKLNPVSKDWFLPGSDEFADMEMAFMIRSIMNGVSNLASTPRIATAGALWLEK